MKLKKILASTLVLGFMCLDITPVFSIENQNTTQKTVKQRKQKKAQPKKETAIDYINLDWWKEFDDLYLPALFSKADAYISGVED